VFRTVNSPLAESVPEPEKLDITKSKSIFTAEKKIGNDA
jgi:hypothetical protein